MSHMSDGELVQYVNSHKIVDIRITREVGTRLEIANNDIDRIQQGVENLTTNYLVMLQDAITFLEGGDTDVALQQIKQIAATFKIELDAAL